MYDIADKQHKNRIDTYIEEWKDKGLLTGYFGMLAKSIYNKTRVKNSEILELLIYGAYIEEQNKLDEYEKQIMYEDVNYYYIQGQEEVNKGLKEKKAISALDMALFLALLEQPNAKGYAWEQYINAITKYNAEQIYRQLTIDLQQQNKLDITNDIYQNIIKRQVNSKLNIKDGKTTSGDIDLELIGLNNRAKVEGIKKLDSKAKAQFISDMCDNVTLMCSNMNNYIFNIDDWNEFDRWYGESVKDLKVERVKVKGLVLGINLPPITHHFHYCHSYITYLPTVENKEETEYNTVDYIRNNKYTNSKNLDSNIKKALKLLPNSIIKLIQNTKYTIVNENSYYDRKNNIIHLLKDSNQYEVLHEIGHVIETKLDILRDKKFIDIQKSGLENVNLITDLQTLKEYQNVDFIKDTGKFISDYQRRIYEYDIDDNYIINYNTYKFNERTLGEYFSEGFRCYFEENRFLKKKDIDLYNYIKEVLE